MKKGLGSMLKSLAWLEKGEAVYPAVMVKTINIKQVPIAGVEFDMLVQKSAPTELSDVKATSKSVY